MVSANAVGQRGLHRRSPRFATPRGGSQKHATSTRKQPLDSKRLGLQEAQAAVEQAKVAAPAISATQMVARATNLIKSVVTKLPIGTDEDHHQAQTTVDAVALVLEQLAQQAALVTEGAAALALVQGSAKQRGG